MSPYHPHLWTRLPGLPGHQEADVGTRGQRQAFVHLWRCRFFNGEAAKMFGKMVVWPKMLTILTKFIPYPRERIRQKWDETDSECLIWNQKWRIGTQMIKPCILGAIVFYRKPCDWNSQKHEEIGSHHKIPRMTFFPLVSIHPHLL